MTGVHPVESILKSPLTIFSLLVNIYGKGINSNAARHFEVHLQLFLLSSRWIHQLAISNAPTHPPCWHYQDSRRNRSPIPGIFRHFGQVVDKKNKETPEKQKLHQPCREFLGDGQQRGQADGCTQSINKKNNNNDNHKNNNDGHVDG